jgi:hypothetical protein
MVLFHSDIKFLRMNEVRLSNKVLSMKVKASAEEEDQDQDKDKR